jgi:DNA-binding LacI/PurR family transcriptional regulator
LHEGSRDTYSPYAAPREDHDGRCLKARAPRGRKVAPELLAPGGWHVADGQNAAAYLMKLPIPLAAIVAANDMVAIGAITKLKELERRVPEDVAVVGYDSIAIAEWYDPTLSTATLSPA